MSTEKIISNLVSAQHGWAVQEQFEETWDNTEKFEECNINALRYIKETINELVKSKVFSEDVNEEAAEYLAKLEEYFTEGF